MCRTFHTKKKAHLVAGQGKTRRIGEPLGRRGGIHEADRKEGTDDNGGIGDLGRQINRSGPM